MIVEQGKYGIADIKIGILEDTGGDVRVEVSFERDILKQLGNSQIETAFHMEIGEDQWSGDRKFKWMRMKDATGKEMIAMCIHPQRFERWQKYGFMSYLFRSIDRLLDMYSVSSADVPAIPNVTGMSNLVRFAKRELSLLPDNATGSADGGNRENEDMQRDVNGQIMEIVRTFDGQGDSGCSASYKLDILEKLLRFKPLTPLTGNDDEWGEPQSIGGETLQQNTRCSSVFRKNKDNSTAHDNAMYSISDDGGITWYHSNDILKKMGKSSSIVFPYSPMETKRIYINYSDSSKRGDFLEITGDDEAISDLRYKEQQSLARDIEK